MHLCYRKKAELSRVFPGKNRNMPERLANQI